MIKPFNDTTFFASEMETLWLRFHQDYPSLTLEAIDSIDSTNSELLRRAKKGQLDTILLTALTQTQGRGRHGKSWQSSPHPNHGTEARMSTPRCLTFSLGFLWPSLHFDGLSLAIGLALANALDERIALKWPNDLLFEGKKLGGILIETTPTPQGRYMIIGIGINVHMPLNEEVANLASSLDQIKGAFTAPTALNLCAGALLTELLRFAHDGFDPIASAWNQKDAFKGSMVGTSDGLVGFTQGVDSSGRLLIKNESGIHTVCSSEVSLRQTIHTAS